jgi:hypothetical protein
MIGISPSPDPSRKRKGSADLDALPALSRYKQASVAASIALAAPCSA